MLRLAFRLSLAGTTFSAGSILPLSRNNNFSGSLTIPTASYCYYYYYYYYHHHHPSVFKARII
jgi:dolichol kinase